jgi:hypothetical protein
VDLKGLRARCEAALGDIEIPVPFDIQTLCDRVSARRGRTLRLLPKDASSGPCGLWLALPEADYVFFEPETSLLHRDHIILHELGHLLCDHGASETIDDDVLRELLPSLDLTMVRRVLGRTTYSSVEEQEAEMFATLVLERARQAPPPGPIVQPEALVLDRLSDLLGGDRRGRG